MRRAPLIAATFLHPVNTAHHGVPVAAMNEHVFIAVDLLHERPENVVVVVGHVVLADQRRPYPFRRNTRAQL